MIFDYSIMTDNKTDGEDQKYDLWNDSSVAYMIGRLMTRTNIPYDDRKLTFEEFNDDYNLLSGFIDWLENNNRTYSYYKFTYNNLKQILGLIDYSIDNSDQIENLMINIIFKV